MIELVKVKLNVITVCKWMVIKCIVFCMYCVCKMWHMKVICRRTLIYIPILVLNNLEECEGGFTVKEKNKTQK